MNKSNHNILKQCIIRCHVSGAVNCLTEQEFRAIWNLMCKDGREKIVFYDGQIANFPEFLEFMQDDSNYVYAVERGGEFVCLAWVNNFLGRCGMIHFTMFHNSDGEEFPICLKLLRFLLYAKSDGNFCFDALYGLTPKVYRHVLRFIEKLGFRLVADMPSSVFFQKNGKKHFKNAVFSIVTRDSVNMLK